MKINSFRSIGFLLGLFGLFFPSAFVFAQSCTQPSNLGQMTQAQQRHIKGQSVTTLLISGVYWEYDDQAETWSAIRITENNQQLPNNDPADVEQKEVAAENGLSGQSQKEINLHLSQVCQTLKNKMKSYDIENGTPETDRTYEVRSFTVCQKEYLGPEMQEIRDALNTPQNTNAQGTNTNQASCPVDYSQGISRLLGCIKASDEYQECEDAIQDSRDRIQELEAGNKDEQTLQDIQDEVANKTTLQEELASMTKNTETQVGFLQGYISAIETYVSNARIQKQAVATGSFDVGRLSIGNEKNYSITTDVESDTNLLTRVIRFALTIIGTLSVVVLVIGGFYMIISNGDENSLQKGKTIVTYALGGVALAFLSYIIVQFVLGVLFATAG